MKIKHVIILYLITIVIGTLSHFGYDFFKLDYLKVVFKTNESIFEHLKLILFPQILIMIIDLLIFKEKEAIQYYSSGILSSIVFLICAFYTYSGILGKSIYYIDISLYYISILIIYYYRYNKITLFNFVNSVIALIVIILIIEIFTFYPIDISFFESS